MADPVTAAIVAGALASGVARVREEAAKLAPWPSDHAREHWLSRWLLTQFAALDDDCPINVLASGEAADLDAVLTLLRESEPAARAAAKESTCL